MFYSILTIIIIAVIGRHDIYKSKVDVLVTMQASEIALKLFGGDEEREVKRANQFQFQQVYVPRRNPSNFGVELILVIEVIKKLGPQHHARDQQSKEDK